MKFKVGAKYTIQFLDHCKGNQTLFCEITAWVVSQDEKALYLTWWRVIDTDEETIEENREMVSIIKSTITKSKKYPELCTKK